VKAFWLGERLASTFWVRAFLAKGKIQVGSRLKAACTNPQNSLSSSALNAYRSAFTEMECDTYPTTKASNVGFAASVHTALLNRANKEIHHKNLQN
jgi:hypothetical protein